MKTFTLRLRSLSLLLVPLVLGSCADGAQAATTEAASIGAGFFDPYYDDDLEDGLWYYAEASQTKPAAVAARPAGSSPAPIGSPLRGC